MNYFTVIVSHPDVRDGDPTWLDRAPGWHRRPRSRPYCRRRARAHIFEGADYALVVDLATGEVTNIYTPNNAPVARRRADGRCPLQHGNDSGELLHRH